MKAVKAENILGLCNTVPTTFEDGIVEFLHSHWGINSEKTVGEVKARINWALIFSLLHIARTSLDRNLIMYADLLAFVLPLESQSHNHLRSFNTLGFDADKWFP